MCQCGKEVKVEGLRDSFLQERAPLPNEDESY